MKILIVTARYYPEPFTITRIAEQLLSLGNSVTVLTGQPHYGKWKIYDGYNGVFSETINGVKILRIKEKPRKRGFFGLLLNYYSILRGFKKELKKIDGTNYDVVFTHVMSPIFAIDGIPNFCKKYKLPHFHYGFDLWPESLIAANYCKRNSILFRIMKKYSKKIYSSCDYIGFASPSGIEYLKKYLNVGVPIVRIPQPCLTKMPSLEEVKHHKYRADGKTHILFCGTVARFTHLDLMLSALSDSTIANEIVFDVVGSGSDLENIQNKCRELNLTNVVFHGRVTVEETKAFFKKADILFVPLYDNSYTSKMIPQKLIEYLMYHRPILGMINGDGRDILLESSTSNFICNQTIESIRESLIKILNTNYEELEKCGRDNRLYIEEKTEYSVESVCESMNNIMESMVVKK